MEMIQPNQGLSWYAAQDRVRGIQSALAQQEAQARLLLADAAQAEAAAPYAQEMALAELASKQALGAKRQADTTRVQGDTAAKERDLLNRTVVPLLNDLKRGKMGEAQFYPAIDNILANLPPELATSLTEADYARFRRLTPEQWQQVVQSSMSVKDQMAEKTQNMPEYVRLLQQQQEALANGDKVMADAIGQRIRKLTYIAPRAETGNDQRERKIQSLMAQGVPRNQAVNIVDRNLDIQVNPATGRIVMTDLVRGTATEVPIGEQQDDRVPVPQRQTLWDMSGQGVTGVVRTAQEAAGRVAGQVGVEIGTDVTERRQMFRSAQQDLIRSLAVNPRFPVAEMERIRKEVDITPKAFDSQPALRARMRAVDKTLRTRLAQATRDANDPNLPEDLRSSQAQNAAAIRNFLDQMGVGQPDAQSVFDEADRILEGR